MSIGTGGLTFAINRAVTVLVITCPHALGLAIPLVTINATAMAAKNGILVRNREAFERARGIQTIAFDKTGTLTEGKFGVKQIYTDGIDEAQAITIAASLESLSEHPLGQSIVIEADRHYSQLAKASDFKAIPGQGVEGVVNGQRYRVGRPEWVQELKLQFPPALRSGLQASESRGERDRLNGRQASTGNLWISRPDPTIRTRSGGEIAANGRGCGDDYRRCRSSGKNRCGGFEDRSLLRSCFTTR